MEVLKLSVDYDGYYGGDVHEYCLLPVEWNGLYANKLELGIHEREIYLGEIEGKHSEVYGDLTVETIDLSTLSSKELNELVNGSYVGEFECTFEGWEGDFNDENEEDLDEINLKRSEFENANGIEYRSEWVIKSVIISKNLIERLKRNLETFEIITIKASNKEITLQLLKDNGIETFQ